MNRTLAALLTACVLCSAPSWAATPEQGVATTANDAGNPLTYDGKTFITPNAFGNSIAGECDTSQDFLVPCDLFQLTVAVPEDFTSTHAGLSLFVRLEWATPATEYDLYLWDDAAYRDPDGSFSGGFPAGNPLASSHNSATTFQQVEIPLKDGTNDYVVQASATLPNGAAYTGKVWIATPSAGNEPAVYPNSAAGIAPRFVEYIPTDADGSPSASLGLFAGEPTMFSNPVSYGSDDPDSGWLFYQGLYEILRVRFDDSTSPARATWEFKDSPTGISNKATVDPILLGDPDTGRIWAMQLAGGQSVTDISDDNGETWTPAISGGFATGADHQGMGLGPYPTAGAGASIPHPLYPNAVYYCSQQIAAAFCARSDDGGQTWGPIVPVYDLVVNSCVGLHGHPKVAPDGTVFLPNKGCGLDTPLLGNGLQNVVVSEDAGITWTIRAVPDSEGSLQTKGDPSVAIDKAGKVYFAYQNFGGSSAPNHLHVATSTDNGRTFSASIDVGALAGVNYAVFPAVVAGDDGRAAVAFFGSPYPEGFNYQSMAFEGVWYLYVATTYDGGETWFVTNATPDHPIQGAFGGIGNGGDNRNHYDFIDAQIDKQGRILVANSIGCAASCVTGGGPNSFTKLAGIVRQSGGRRMYAEFDPVESEFAVPAAPLLSGSRSADRIVLKWVEPDGNGAVVTGYNVYRSIDGGAETVIATATTNRLLVDASDATRHYSYRVTALSGQGEGASSNAFAPEVGENAPAEATCSTVPDRLYADRRGEGGALPNNDIASFGVAEPAAMPGKLVFVVNNAYPELTSVANSDYYVYFDPPGGQRYRLDLTNGEVTNYVNGQFVSTCGTAGTNDCMDWQHVGDLDAASGVQADGSVWLVMDKATFGLNAGDVLQGVSIRVDTVGNPSTVITSDYAGGRQDYTLTGNDVCGQHRRDGTAYDVARQPLEAAPASAGGVRGGAIGVFALLQLLLTGLMRRRKSPQSQAG